MDNRMDGRTDCQDSIDLEFCIDQKYIYFMGLLKDIYECSKRKNISSIPLPLGSVYKKMSIVVFTTLMND